MAGSASIVVTIAEILLQCSELLEWRSQVPGIFHAKMQFDQIGRSPNMCPVRIHTRYLPHASTNLLSALFLQSHRSFTCSLVLSGLIRLPSFNSWSQGSPYPTHCSLLGREKRLSRLPSIRRFLSLIEKGRDCVEPVYSHAQLLQEFLFGVLLQSSALVPLLLSPCPTRLAAALGTMKVQLWTVLLWTISPLTTLRPSRIRPWTIHHL